jgi:hypothetical protein
MKMSGFHFYEGSKEKHSLPLKTYERKLEKNLVGIEIKEK